MELLYFLTMSFLNAPVLLSTLAAPYCKGFLVESDCVHGFLLLYSLGHVLVSSESLFSLLWVHSLQILLVEIHDEALGHLCCGSFVHQVFLKYALHSLFLSNFF